MDQYEEFRVRLAAMAPVSASPGLAERIVARATQLPQRQRFLFDIRWLLPQMAAMATAAVIGFLIASAPVEPRPVFEPEVAMLLAGSLPVVEEWTP